jgi:hypothetical protein
LKQFTFQSPACAIRANAAFPEDVVEMQVEVLSPVMQNREYLPIDHWRRDNNNRNEVSVSTTTSTATAMATTSRHGGDQTRIRSACPTWKLF